MGLGGFEGGVDVFVLAGFFGGRGDLGVGEGEDAAEDVLVAEGVFVDGALEGAVFSAVYAKDGFRGQVELPEKEAEGRALHIDGVPLVFGERPGLGGVVAGHDLVDEGEDFQGGFAAEGGGGGLELGGREAGENERGDVVAPGEQFRGLGEGLGEVDIAQDLLDGLVHVHDGLEQLLGRGGGGKLGVFAGLGVEGGLHDAADHPRRHALGAQGVEEVDAGLFGGEVAVGGCSDFGEVGAQGVDPGLDLVRCAQFAGPVDTQAGDVFGDEALEVEVVAAVGEGVPDDGFGGGAVVARQLGGDETGMRHRLGLVLPVVDAHRSRRGLAVHVDGRGPVELEREALRLGVLDGDGAGLVVARERERKGHVFV